MHHARLSKSDRLKRVAKLLGDRREHSTMDICRHARYTGRWNYNNCPESWANA